MLIWLRQGTLHAAIHVHFCMQDIEAALEVEDAALSLIYRTVGRQIPRLELEERMLKMLQDKLKEEIDQFGDDAEEEEEKVDDDEKEAVEEEEESPKKRRVPRSTTTKKPRGNSKKQPKKQPTTRARTKK